MNPRIISFALLTASIGCGGGDRLVSGQLDLASLGRSEGRLVAVRANERLETPITADGQFAIALPPGRWAIAYADTQGNGGRIFANLLTSKGADRSGTWALSSGEELRLGMVRPITVGAGLRATDDNGGHGNEPGDDNGGNGNEPGDDHGQDREDCRQVGPAGDISAFASFLVVGDDSPSLDTAGLPENEPELSDSDDDGRPDLVDEDHDGDDICDEDESHHHGDDDGSDAGEADAGDVEDDDSEADLPYDVRLEIGDTFSIADAFASEGVQPDEVLSIAMEGGSWRLAELQSGAAFTVDQSDCDHVGNRDTGRDRIFVSWRNSDGSLDVDHLDLRYCGR